MTVDNLLFYATYSAFQSYKGLKHRREKGDSLTHLAQLKNLRVNHTNYAGNFAAKLGCFCLAYTFSRFKYK